MSRAGRLQAQLHRWMPTARQASHAATLAAIAVLGLTGIANLATALMGSL